MGRKGGVGGQTSFLKVQNDVKYLRFISFLFVFIPPLSAQVYMGLYSTNLNIPWGKYICSFPNAQSTYNTDAMFLAWFTLEVRFAVDVK